MTSFSRAVTDLVQHVPKDMYVKLIAADDQEFYIKRDYVLTSQTIKTILSEPGQYAENEINTIRIPALSSAIIARFCCYCAYKARYSNSMTEIPEFPVPPDQALALLEAATYLKC